MKRLALILAALAVSASAVLTGCNQTPTNVPQEENKQPAVIDSEVAEYNAELQAVVNEFEPKSELDNEILGSINGIPLTASQVKYAASYTAFSENEGITGEELKNISTNSYKEYAAVVALAKEYNIEIDETLKNYVSTSISSMKDYFNSLGEGEYEKYFVDVPFTPHFYHLQTLVYQYLYQQNYSKFCENEEVKASALEGALKFYEDNDYVRAKHILVMFPEGEGENGEISDAQKAATLEKANAVLAEVNAMTDISEFDALIEKHNEDPGMQSNPNGYYFGKGEMVPEFEEAAYALEEGKTSGLVETSYGYHILLKLPINDDKLSESTKYNEMTTEQYYKMMDERIAAEFEIVYNDNYEEKFNQFKDEYKAAMEKQAADELAEAEAQAEAEEAAE